MIDDYNKKHEKYKTSIKKLELHTYIIKKNDQNDLLSHVYKTCAREFCAYFMKQMRILFIICKTHEGFVHIL